MTLKSRIRERGFNAGLIVLFIFSLIIYSFFANAQSSQDQFIGNRTINQGVKTNKKVVIATGVNTEAKSVALGNSINSPFAELKPVLSPCGGKLYFSRFLHPDNKAGKSVNEDIWYSEHDLTTNTWSAPIHMTGALNNSGPNFINNVSMTGDTIILGNQYRKKGKMYAGLSYSVNDRGQWSIPISIHVLNDYNMSEHANAYVSLKNGIIISAIERAETHGDRDLYVSFWDGMQATEPINMGGVINSDLEESSPFLASDNKTLYFASKGHAGFGGYDIFVTKRLDESWTNWTTPENLGPAVNSAMNDEFFNVSRCGKYALFSRQVSVHNTDLYKIKMDELFEKPENKVVAPAKYLNSALGSL